MKAHVEKCFLLKKTCPSPMDIPIVEQQPTTMNLGLEKFTIISNNWGIQNNLLQNKKL